MGFTCNLYKFQICFGRFGQVLHGIYLQFYHCSKSVFGALAKCCMGFTCIFCTFPNLFLALWPSAAWDLLAIYSIFQICFWRFGQVLHGIYLQFIHFSKSVFGALAKCCMGFTCNLFNFQICFGRFGQVLHGIYLQFIQFAKSVFGALAKCCMRFTCNLFNFPNLFLALWPSAAWDLLAIFSLFQICFFGRFGQVLHGIYLQFIHCSKSVFGALAKCCMGFTCNVFIFPNLFRALWPSAAWDLLAMYAMLQICFWRFGQVLHGIYLQLIHFSKSVFGALAKCCMGFTCNLFNFPNLFRALWPSAAWDLLAIYSICQICFWRFGQVLHAIYLQFIQFSKSVFGALAKCCMGFTCNLFTFPNLFFWALWPSAAWDLLANDSISQICFWRFGQVLHGIYLQCIHFSKSVSGALAKCCMGFTCNVCNAPNLFLALWPSAAWDLLAMYAMLQICFWRFGQVLHGIYLQCIQFSKSVFGALAKCCMGFTCNLFNFPNLFSALWPSAAWDLLAIYSLFQICFWRFGQVLHGIYLQIIQFPNLFRALWPSAAWDLLAIYSLFQICFWRFGQVLHGIYLQFIQFPNLFFALWPRAAWDLLAIYSIFQICFWRFGQVLHGIYLQFIQFSKSVFGAFAKCCMGFTCNLFNFPNRFWRFGQVLHGIYLQFIQVSKSFLALWPSAAWDLLAVYSIFQICFWRFCQVLHGIHLQFIQFSKSFLALWPSAAWDSLAIYSIFQICFSRFGQVLHGIYLQFIQFSKSVFGALANTCNLFNFPNLFRALWPSAAWDLLAIYSIFQICFWRFGQVLHGIHLQFVQFSKSFFRALARCCMGFTCNLFTFPNLFSALCSGFGSVRFGFGF